MMDQHRNPGLDATIAAAFDWWRVAGVDCDFADSPRDWLAVPEAAASPAQGSGPVSGPVSGPASGPISSRTEPPPPAIVRDDLPQDLPGFAAWWLDEPSLDDGRTTGRVPPRGPVGAAVMVLVPQPEADDTGRLLSGAQGRLLDAMLGAMGLDEAEAYIASALPRHTPHADWAFHRAAGMGAILAHHVALVAPQRLIVLGGNILPLLGNDPPLSSDSLQRFNQGGRSVPMLADRELAAMIERPIWKAGFWKRWLDWSLDCERPARSTDGH